MLFEFSFGVGSFSFLVSFSARTRFRPCFSSVNDRFFGSFQSRWISSFFLLFFCRFLTAGGVGGGGASEKVGGFLFRFSFVLSLFSVASGKGHGSLIGRSPVLSFNCSFQVLFAVVVDVDVVVVVVVVGFKAATNGVRWFSFFAIPLCEIDFFVVVVV